MKKNLFLFLGSLLIAITSFAQAGNTPATGTPAGNTQTTGALAGNVTDSATGKPLPGCSVYINNTSIGTVTGADGSFRLHNIPKGRSELIISAIGYRTYVTEITGDSLPAAYKVRLRPKITELSAFTVEVYDKNGWSKYGQIFLDNFLGSVLNANASSCSIQNRKVLRFFFSKKNNRLSVSATEPLIIENHALGYNLQYQLEQFSLDYNSQVVIYLGYPLFREMPAKHKHQEQEWIENRRQAYLGSLRQFLRSLYYDCPSLQGFSMNLPQTVLNEDKQWVKKAYNPEFSPDTYPPDSLKLYQELLRQPDYIIRTLPVNTNDLVSIDRLGTRIFYFTGTLDIYYRNVRADKADRHAGLKLVHSSPVAIQADGGFYPAKGTAGLGSLGADRENLQPSSF